MASRLLFYIQPLTPAFWATRPLCYTNPDSPSLFRKGHNQEIPVMPKLKTHKGAAKRFKKTGTGKIVRQHAFARHILTSKTRSRKRKLGQSVVADETNQPALRTMLPY